MEYGKTKKKVEKRDEKQKEKAERQPREYVGKEKEGTEKKCFIFLW